MPTWSTASDWDGAQLRQGVHDEQPAGTDWAPADQLEKGLPGSDWGTTTLPEPVLYAPCQEDSGTTAYDVTGNGNDGTISGATVNATPAPLGNSAHSYDGVDDVTNFGVAMPDISATGGFTVAFFMRTTTSTTTKVCGVGRTNTTVQFAIRLNEAAGDFGFVVHDDDGGFQTKRALSGGVTDGSWHLCAVTIDASVPSFAFYTDGANTRSSTAGDAAEGPFSFATQGSEVRLGATPGEYVNADLAHYLWFDEVLSDSQHTALWDAFAGSSTYVSSKKQL